MDPFRFISINWFFFNFCVLLGNNYSFDQLIGIRGDMIMREFLRISLHNDMTQDSLEDNGNMVERLQSDCDRGFAINFRPVARGEIALTDYRTSWLQGTATRTFASRTNVQRVRFPVATHLPEDITRRRRSKAVVVWNSFTYSLKHHWIPSTPPFSIIRSRQPIVWELTILFAGIRIPRFFIVFL